MSRVPLPPAVPENSVVLAPAAAVKAYLAREKEVFDQEDLPSEAALSASVISSPRTKALAEYLFQLNVMGVGQGYRLNGEDNDYLPYQALGAIDSVDRAFNEYGHPDHIAKKIAAAHLSVVERTAVMDEMRNHHFDEEIADAALLDEVGDAYRRLHPDAALVESALSDLQRKGLKQLLRKKRIASFAQHVKDRELIREVGESYQTAHPGVVLTVDTELSNGQRESLIQLLGDKLFVQHYPQLNQLLLAAKQEAQEAKVAFNAVTASYPHEMVTRAHNFYSDLELELPTTTREVLEYNMGHWMAANLSITLLYLQTILDSRPSLLDELQEKYPLAKADEVLPKLGLAFMLGLSDVVLATIPITENPLFSYLSNFVTRTMSEVLDKVKVPVHSAYQLKTFGLLEYLIFLLENQNKAGSLKNEDQINLAKLRDVFSLSKTSEIFAQQIALLFETDDLVTLYQKLSLVSRLCNFSEYSIFVNAIVNILYHDISEFEPQSLVTLLAHDLNKERQAYYVEFVAALFLSRHEDSGLQRKILAAVPKAQQLEVCEVIVRMSSELPANTPKLQAMNMAIIKFAMEAYLVAKSAESSGNDEKEKFMNLKANQQAERNIAAAYELLYLTKQWEQYNQSQASVTDKELAYKAVMGMALYLRADAETRGVRPAQLYKQSSQFAQLLNFTIPGIELPLSLEVAESALSSKFSMAGYLAIKQKHRAENTWLKRFFKKSSHWALQNPGTLLALAVGAAFFAAGVLTLALIYFAPAILALIPLVGSFAPSSLVLPGIGSLVAGAFIAVLATVINEARNTVKAKMKNLSLGELGELDLKPPAALKDMVTPAGRRGPSLSQHSPPAIGGAAGTVASSGARTIDAVVPTPDTSSTHGSRTAVKEQAVGDGTVPRYRHSSPN